MACGFSGGFIGERESATVSVSSDDSQLKTDVAVGDGSESSAAGLPIPQVAWVSLHILALVAIILFQLRPSILPSGFLGIEIILVLAGFASTAILLQQWQARGRVVFPNIWGRLIPLWWPPLVLLTFVIVPVALVLNRDLLVGVRHQLLGTYTFTFNWIQIWFGAEPFGRTVPTLFDNLWIFSLLVQFLLLWPLVFGALTFAFRNWGFRVAVVVVLAVLSALSMGVLFSPALSISRVYYGLDTHAFPLFLGALVAFFWMDEESYVLDRVQGLKFSISFIVLGLLGVVAGLVFLNLGSVVTFRGGMAGFALAVALLLWGLLLLPDYLNEYAGHAWVSQLTAHIFGVYIWFWPLSVIIGSTWTVSDFSLRFWIEKATALVLSIVFAVVSYRLVQSPLETEGVVNSVQNLRHTSPPIRRSISWGLTALAIVAIAGAMWAPSASYVTRTVLGDNRDGRLTIVTEATALSAQLDAAKRIHEVKTNTTDPDERAAIAKKYAAKKLPSPLKPTGSEVTVIGDQMLLEARSEIEKRFPGLAMYADNKNSWANVKDIISQVGKEKNLRGTVVIAFGASKGFNDPQALNSILGALGPTRQVVFVNHPSSLRDTDKTNQALSQLAQTHVNVAIADWARVVQDNPGYLQANHALPSNTGAPAVAAVIDSAFEELSKQILQSFERQ